MSECPCQPDLATCILEASKNWTQDRRWKSVSRTCGNKLDRIRIDAGVEVSAVASEVTFEVEYKIRDMSRFPDLVNCFEAWDALLAIERARSTLWNDTHRKFDHAMRRQGIALVESGNLFRLGEQIRRGMQIT